MKPHYRTVDNHQRSMINWSLRNTWSHIFFSAYNLESQTFTSWYNIWNSLSEFYLKMKRKKPPYFTRFVLLNSFLSNALYIIVCRFPRFFVGHSIVYPSSICGFWLSLRYLELFLSNIQVSTLCKFYSWSTWLKWYIVYRWCGSTCDMRMIALYKNKINIFTIIIYVLVRA